MEEIKFIAIIIITLCTYFKFKSTFRANTQIPKQKQKDLSELPSSENIEISSQKAIDPQFTALADSLIFPPTSRLPKRYKSKSFQEEERIYRQSLIVEPSCPSQPTLIYSNGFFNKNPFNTAVSKLMFRTNEEYLKQVEHLMVEPFTTESSMMCIEQDLEEEHSQTRKAVPIKRKTIVKRRKFGQRKEVRESVPVLTTSLKGKSKKNKMKRSSFFINIDKQIEKRLGQIEVLKRLKKERSQIRLS